MEIIVDELISRSGTGRVNTTFKTFLDNGEIFWEFIDTNGVRNGTLPIDELTFPEINLGYPDADLLQKVLQLTKKTRDIIKQRPTEIKKTFVPGVGVVEENITKELSPEERKLAAEWFFCQGLMKDLITNDTSYENWESKKDTYLQGKVSYKIWKRWFDENPIEKKESAPRLREQVLAFFHKKQYGEGTEILVKEIEKNNFIYTTKVDKASEVYIYYEGIYIPEGEFHIKEQLRLIMEESYSEWVANQVMSKVRMDTGISAAEFFRDRNTYQIPVENGILDVKSLELLPFQPDKIFFSKLPVRYEAGATCEKIDQFLKDVLTSPRDKDVFYELSGFGLIKDYLYEKAFMFVGDGRNGKGKAIELLKRLVGAGNCASVPLSAITSDSPFVERLWKRFFNLAGDISSKDLKETGMFKQLTGRDPVSANRKYKNVVEFCNYAKMVFACNELPRVYDYSDGFWERWILLEFPYKFVDKDIFDSATTNDKKMWKIKDPNIINEITTEDQMSGFLNMALLGLHRLFKNKKFSYTPGSTEVKNKWIRKADSFMAFCMDMIEDDYDSKISKKEIRNVYKNYCKIHKVGGVSDKAIKATLQEMFGASEEFIRPIGGVGNQEWHWSGIKFKLGIKGINGFP